MIELPRLLDAARRFEKSDGEDRSAVKELLDAGTGSLAGSPAQSICPGRAAVCHR
jgi:hypothetical protein